MLAVLLFMKKMKLFWSLFQEEVEAIFDT